MEKLKSLINDCFMTKSELCERAKISRQTLINIMKGYHSPSIYTIKKICKALDVDYKDYL